MTSTVQVGFAASSLWGAWATDAPLMDEVTAQAMVVIDPAGLTSVLITSDLCLLWPAICKDIRVAAAAALDTPIDQVGVFCTQNHGLPFTAGDSAYDMHRLIAVHVDAAVAAKRNARPAVMAIVDTAIPQPAIINRRKLLPDLGAFTYWFGHRITDDGKANCAELLRDSLEALAAHADIIPKCPVSIDPNRSKQQSDDRRRHTNDPSTIALPPIEDHAHMDSPADERIQAIFFRDLDGQPIGAVTRVAAHPATATGIGGAVGGDYPVYIRRALAATFGGTIASLTGPCGNQCVAVGTKSIDAAQQFGRRVADALLRDLYASTWEPITTTHAATQAVSLPFRSDLPTQPAQAAAELAAARIALDEQRTAGASLAALKPLSERVETLHYLADDHFRSWTGVTFDDLAVGAADHPLFAMTLNRLVIAGLPSEPFGEYSMRLRDAFPDRHVIVAEECNGYLSYIPTAAACPEGGYEVCAAMFGPDVEPILLGAAQSLIRKVIA